jgi:hypothetical protein
VDTFFFIFVCVIFPGVGSGAALIRINGLNFLIKASVIGFLFAAVLFFVLFVMNSVVVFNVIVILCVAGLYGPLVDNQEKRNAEREEWEHQRILGEKHREQEQIEADRAIFNAEQGLKKQDAVAPTRMDMWTAKAEAKKLDATYTLDQARKPNPPAVGAPSIREMLSAEHERGEWPQRSDRVALGGWRCHAAPSLCGRAGETVARPFRRDRKPGARGSCARRQC